MSRRSLWAPICFAALYTACGDPYVAPRDGGAGDPAADSGAGKPGDDGGGTKPTDDGGVAPEDTSVKPDLGAPGSPCASSGKTETSTCGKCGSRTRICQSSLAWSDWSSCSGEGVCSS